MTRKKLFIAAAVAVLLVLGILFFNFLHPPSEFERLISLRRAEARHGRWESTAPYRWFCRLTKTDPRFRCQLRADQLQKSLLKSGGLVSVTFELFGEAQFNHKAQQFGGVHQRYYDMHGSFDDRFHEGFQTWDMYVGKNSSSNDTPSYVCLGSKWSDKVWAVVCPPQEVSFWQQKFCLMRSRIRLAEFGKVQGMEGRGLKEYAQYLLPDNSTVGFFECQKWLNDNITIGWRVGLMSSNTPVGDVVYVAVRAK